MAINSLPSLRGSQSSLFEAIAINGGASIYSPNLRRIFSVSDGLPIWSSSLERSGGSIVVGEYVTAVVDGRVVLEKY